MTETGQEQGAEVPAELERDRQAERFINSLKTNMRLTQSANERLSSAEQDVELRGKAMKALLEIWPVGLAVEFEFANDLHPYDANNVPLKKPVGTFIAHDGEALIIAGMKVTNLDTNEYIFVGHTGSDWPVDIRPRNDLQR